MSEVVQGKEISTLDIETKLKEAEERVKIAEDRAIKSEEVMKSMKDALEIERKKKVKRSKSKKEEDLQEDEDEDEEESSASKNDTEEYAKLVDQKIDALRMSLVQETIEKKLSDLSSDDKERDLIREQYMNKIKPSGFDSSSVEKDLKLAKAAVHIDRLSFKTDNSGQVAIASTMVGSSGKPLSASSITEDDVQVAQEVGMDPEKYAKYRKMLDKSSYSTT